MIEGENQDLNQDEEQFDTKKFKEYFDEAKYQLKFWEGKKQTTIQDLAKKLENAGMPTHMICAEIIKELEGYAAKRWIETVLDDKYKRKYEKPQVILTNGEKFEEIKKRINGHIEDKNRIEDNPSPQPKRSYDEEVKSLWQNRDGGNDQRNKSSIHYTPNNSIPDDLITKVEYDKKVRDLQTVIEKLQDFRNKQYKNTKEYQDQQQLIEFQKLRISELEEIETKTIQEFSFNSASNLATKTVNLTQRISEELTFASSKLAKFFIDARNCKKRMLLKHDEHDITDWRVE